MSYDRTCMYCAKSSDLDAIAVKICELKVSTLYLFREQTYKGRCIVAYREHVREMHDLSDEALCSYILDIKKVSGAIGAAFSPDKMNIANLGDIVSHLHVHVIPKYAGGPQWGDVFKVNPQLVYPDESELAALSTKIRSYL